MAEVERTKHRVEDNFNYDYAPKGGVEKLLSMVEQTKTLTEIAAHFDVSKGLISRKIEIITGKPYSWHLHKKGISRPGLQKVRR